MGKYDGWTCLTIVFSHVSFGFYNSFRISCLGVQVSKFVQSFVQILLPLCCMLGKYG